ncbi:MAG: leucine-rich repeat domain-containing protein, partial [Oscillibacter sp.]|nr:leucine-rich repeat domain-containing protein [Oscillibacter sp.]
MKKKLLSLALALVLCMSLTVPAYAAGDFVIEDGVLTSYTGSARSVVIPDGVTAIGYGAFAVDCENVTEIKIPNTVTSIGRAFSGCENLKRITIPASVTEIEEGAFYFAGLTNIEVDPANSYYTSVDGVLFNQDKTLLVQYPMNKAGSSYAVPAGVTRIGDSAFGVCDNLTRVTIPDGVSSIGASAFDYCRNLTNITIPSSVTDFGFLAFGETPWLEQLGEFPIVNHCLLRGPHGKSSVVIPDGVTTICEDAFRFEYDLKHVEIPDSVTKICDSAFIGCEALTNLTIPNTVTEIGDE